MMDDDNSTEDLNVNAISVCLMVMMVGIVLSNSFVVGILITRKSLRNVPNIYIIALCFSHLLVGTFVIISTEIGFSFISHTGAWCACAPFFELFSFTSGILFLIGITRDRYRSIVYPLSYKPKIRTAVYTTFILIVISFIYSLRFFIQLAVTDSPTKSESPENTTDMPLTEDIFCNLLTENTISDLWFRILDFGILFVIPIISMAVMYYQIIKRLWAKSIVASASTIRKRKTVILSVVCVSSFLICWLPFYAIDIIHDVIGIVKIEDAGPYTYNVIRYVTIFLALLNSLANPILYGFLNKNFMTEVCILKRHYCCKRNKVTTSQTLPLIDAQDTSNERSERRTIIALPSDMQGSTSKENFDEEEKQTTISYLAVNKNTKWQSKDFMDFPIHSAEKRPAAVL